MNSILHDQLLHLIEQTRQFIYQEKVEGGNFFVKISHEPSHLIQKKPIAKEEHTQPSPSKKVSHKTPEERELSAEKPTEIKIPDKKPVFSAFTLEPIPVVSSSYPQQIAEIYPKHLKKTKDSTIYLLAYDEESEVFYNKIAQALIQIHANALVTKINESFAWEDFLKNPSMKLILAPLSQLQKVADFQSTPFSIHEILTLKKVNFLPLAETVDYAKEIQLKQTLWNLLKQCNDELS